ncbi:TPA: DMT family transporter [Streptococcus pneumoniae]|uniref:DMT family transporter n=1 Tax=Streptococcus pneumoniae TaxID=1313 RepID=UPI00094115B1|nr:DMT family transporter [Streptococcus pneumoniae]OKQ76997.1 EamA family transporter [Streptococcus pneumoniae]VOO78712.1 membrane protein [Streptococcus pneumoniae]HES9468017.1 EamA family transporter [Streptococcus pneumoniae]HEW4056013.1 EamA family transporter [Streptococcus pneumoniae]HEW5082135.1 EamA family transporter [Streptococcus pneumoniae]
MSNSLKGTLLTVVAGIAWGLSGTSGQYLMARGISALVLTNLRLLIAGGILMLLAYATAKDKILVFLKDRKSLLSLLIFALIGLFLNQFAYLSAIQETNAGTATVLQYVCPVGILIYSCIKDRVAPTLGEIVSIIFAIGGTFLIATHGQLDQLSMTPAGLFWGLFSALTYALYIILPIALIKKWGSSLVIGVGMVIAGLVALPFTGILQADIPTSLDFLLAFAGIILIGTVFAYTAFLKGASLIGPVKSSLLASIEPISAVFFAFLIMNEQFYPIDFIGMAMILFAVTLISLKDLFLEK